MYRVSIEKKMKRFASVAAILAFFTACAALFGLHLFTDDLSIAHVGVGAGIALMVVLIGYFIVFSMASSWAGETKNDASNIANTISAMSNGNFANTLRHDTPGEIGEIEKATFQLAQVQASFVKDFLSFTKRHSQNETNVLIDEKNYGGDFRELIREINNTATLYSNSIIEISNALRALANGDTHTKSLTGKSEINRAYEDLRRKFESITREHNNALSSLDTSKREIGTLRDDVASAKREASAAREEASAARREAASRPQTPLRPVTAPAHSLFPKPVAAIKPPSAFKSNDNAPLSVKSVKIATPSGAHEYDRKDYGKY